MMKLEVIVALGDSITYGFPYTPTESWVYLVAARCGLQMINMGICGDTLGGMAARFGRDVFRLRPHAVILLGGANDVFSYIDLDTMRENMEDMINMAEQQGILPILGLPTPCDFIDEATQLTEFRIWLSEFSHTKALPAIDFFTPLANRHGKFADGLAVDGIHPTMKGYERMADAAATVLGNLDLKQIEAT